jgi:hypothetical protein
MEHYEVCTMNHSQYFLYAQILDHIHLLTACLQQRIRRKELKSDATNTKLRKED